MRQYILIGILLSLFIIGLSNYDYFSSPEVSEDVSEHVSEDTLTNFVNQGRNEKARLQRMENIEKYEYIDIENRSATNEEYCTMCGAQITAMEEQKKRQKQKRNVKEGFYGDGPGEFRLPRNPKTGETCCPVCYKAEQKGKEKKCVPVCHNGTYQDLSCLSEDQYESFFKY